jgi:hypothetical protein
MRHKPLTFKSRFRGGLVSNVHGRRLWGCAWCGKTDVWGPGWMTYGSAADDDSRSSATLCSIQCAAECARANRWPSPLDPEAQLDD